MANTYDVGDVVRLNGVFQDADTDDYLDPSTVKAMVKTPVGAKTTYTYGVDGALVRDSLGNYHINIEPAIQGVWRYRWEGTGTNKGAAENSFTIRESFFD